MAGGQRDADAAGGRDSRPPEDFDPAARDSNGADPYLSLSGILLAVLTEGGDPDETGRRIGRLIGSAASDDTATEPCIGPAELEKFLHSRGFMPKQIGDGPETGFEIGRCPYEEAALANPRLICGLHRALAEGILDALGGDFEVARLVARHPTTAGCLLELRAADQAD